MSVYTSVSHAQIELFIRKYGLSSLVSYSGISAGMENTNYLLHTRQGDFVLTLYEYFNVDELRPYLQLLLQLARFESYYPCPLSDLQQGYVQILSGKPAAIFKCLPGKSVVHTTLQQYQLVATTLAGFHLTGSSIEFNKQNPRNIVWIQKTAQQVSAHLSLQDSLLLEDELQYQLKSTTQHLRQGIIHADLFRDNVLFAGDRLTGMLDFYAACCDCLLLDVAIALNDWCVDAQGLFDYELSNVFMQAYKQVRDIPQSEENWLPVLLRRASLRFWLSRLEHKIYPRVGLITQQKNPENFKKLLLQHRQFYSEKNY